MRKILLLTCVFFILSTIFPMKGYTKDEIKNYQKMVIYVKNREYNKENVYMNKGELWTSLSSLSKALKFEYNYDQKGSKLYVENIEYTGPFNVKGNAVYVPLKSFCEANGYYVSYDSKTNIMDISTKPVATITTSVTSGTNNSIQSNTVKADNFTVIPNKGIEGLVYLGSDIKDVNLGPSIKKENIDGRGTPGYAYINYMIVLATGQDNKVSLIMTMIPSYKTAEGITVGSTFADVKRCYGNQFFPKDNGTSTMIMYMNGLVFMIKNDTQTVDMFGVLSFGELMKNQ